MGREQSLKLAITVSSGSGTGTVISTWDTCYWLRVHPVGESDTYTLQVKDADGFLMLSRTSQLGTFSEKIEMSLGIMRTIAISSASADGQFLCHFDLHHD